MSIPKVLVTGCAGFIGCQLTSFLLRSGCRVVGVDSLRYSNATSLLPVIGDEHFEFYEADVCDAHLMQQFVNYCDTLIPLAALVGAPLCEKFPVLARWVNYEAVKTLVKAASPSHHIIYPNTNSGYGATDGFTACVETDRLTPISVYGRTKCDAEAVVLDHPNSAVLRLATVFGVSPRMRFDLMVNHFTKELCWNQSLRLGKKHFPTFSIYEPHFKRNFVGIKDVVRAFGFLAAKPWLKGVFNLGLPTANLTKMELAHKVCDVIGLSRKVVVEGQGADPDQRNYLVSNDKILRAGFEFKQELEDGIREVQHVCNLFSQKQLDAMGNV